MTMRMMNSPTLLSDFYIGLNKGQVIDCKYLEDPVEYLLSPKIIKKIMSNEKYSIQLNIFHQLVKN